MRVGPNSSNQFSANVVWMDENSMLLNNNYFLNLLATKLMVYLILLTM